jgi:hypothetical protein
MLGGQEHCDHHHLRTEHQQEKKEDRQQQDSMLETCAGAAHDRSCTAHQPEGTGPVAQKGTGYVAQKGTGYASLWALVYVFSPMCYISPPSSCARPRVHTQRQPLSFVASPGSIPRISHNPLAQAWLFFGRAPLAMTALGGA